MSPAWHPCPLIRALKEVLDGHGGSAGAATWDHRDELPSFAHLSVADPGSALGRAA
jgi:hypothetical protein